MSATSGKLRLVFQLLAALAVIVAGVAVLIVFLRPVAVVESVVAGDALDAKPGSVTVAEAYPQDLTSELAGRVLPTDFRLNPGEKVKTGEILAQLDPTDIQLEINQEKIDYAATKARFAADHSSELKLETAHDALANFERLNKIGMYADTDLTARKREVEAQDQALQLEKIDNQQKLDTGANNLKIDERKVEKMTIRSPMDGTVSVVRAHPGDLIPANTPVATLITSSMVVIGKISEEDFAQVKVGEDANVTFLPYGDWNFDAKVSKILPTADAETQRHQVYLDVTLDANHQNALVPGINGEVTIIVGRHSAKAVVPRRALFSLNGDNVYVVKDGRVELRRVKTGYIWARGAEILEGLEPGEKVIVDQLENFHQGDRVRVQEVASDVAKK